MNKRLLKKLRGGLQNWKRGWKMEINKAHEIVNDFKQALTQIQTQASMYGNCKTRNERLENDLKELKIKLDESSKFKYLFNKLAAASNVAICGQCDGRGGFDYDDGHGGGGSEICNACEGSGIVDKKETTNV